MASQPHIGGMPHLDLSDDEAAALAKLLTRTIDGYRYPLSPRVQTLRAILNKLRPEPAREPPPPKLYAPTAGRPSQEAPLLNAHKPRAQSLKCRRVV